MTRHTILALPLALLLAAATVPPAHAGEPTTQLSNAVGRVLKTVADPALKSPNRTAERRTAVRQIVNDIFDFQETAKRALGPHWQQRTPQEQQQFVQLFADLLEASYLTKVDLYNGEKVSYVGETVDGDQAVVKTQIAIRPGSQMAVDYRMHRANDRWLAYDVTIEGVSLVANYRAQFNKIIQTSSYESLISRMKSRAGSQPSAAETAPVSASPSTAAPATAADSTKR